MTNFEYELQDLIGRALSEGLTPLDEMISILEIELEELNNMDIRATMGMDMYED